MGVAKERPRKSTDVISICDTQDQERQQTPWLSVLQNAVKDTRIHDYLCYTRPRKTTDVMGTCPTQDYKKKIDVMIICARNDSEWKQTSWLSVLRKIVVKDSTR